MAEAQEKMDVKGLKEERIPTKLSGEGHDVAFDFDGIPEKLYVGDKASLVMFAACESGCDLVGDKITVYDMSYQEVATSVFSRQEAELAVSEPIAFTMPDVPGDYQYIVHYEAHELPLPDDGGPAFKNPHEERDLLLVFKVEAHHVTVSNWGVTSPVWVNEPISMSVGVSCTSGCCLRGQRVEIYNEDNVLMCSGTLKDPEPPRNTLYWCEVEAKAPEEAKLHRWEARFCPEGLTAPHEAATHKFSFVARVPPERTLFVTVIDDKTDKPQRSARVELKPADGTGKALYASTGAEGTASIGATKGKFTLRITAPSRRPFTADVDLTEANLDVEIHIQVTGTTGELTPLKFITPEERAKRDAESKAKKPAPVTSNVDPDLPDDMYNDIY